jgi:hypothetical protein
LRRTKDERKFEEEAEDLQRKTTKKQRNKNVDRVLKLTAE